MAGRDRNGRIGSRESRAPRGRGSVAVDGAAVSGVELVLEPVEGGLVDSGGRFDGGPTDIASHESWREPSWTESKAILADRRVDADRQRYQQPDYAPAPHTASVSGLVTLPAGQTDEGLLTPALVERSGSR